MTTLNVAVLVGSLRSGSFSRQIASSLSDLAPAGLKLQIVEIGELPLYNPDLDEGTIPAAWSSFRSHLQNVDSVLFITPEYNRSIPAALKNALDVGSRPYGKGVWGGKPAAVISQSPGPLAGFGANHHLRQVLASQGMPILPDEVYLSGVDKLFENGKISRETTVKFLSGFLEHFNDWTARNSKA